MKFSVPCGWVTERRSVSDDLADTRVAYADAFGAYTTVRLYPEYRITVIPDGVTDDQAASSLLKGLTARYLLKETVQLHEGDTVLYHAATGGVGPRNGTALSTWSSG